MRVEDVIEPAAGIVLKKKVGDSVNAGDTLAVLYTDNESILDQARHRLEGAFNIATEPSAQPPLIHAMIDEQGVHPWQGDDQPG